MEIKFKENVYFEGKSVPAGEVIKISEADFKKHGFEGLEIVEVVKAAKGGKKEDAEKEDDK